MAKRPGLRNSVLLGAFFLSLFLHGLTLWGDELYAWLVRPELGETELKKSSRTLKEQTLLDDEILRQMAGISRVDELEVYPWRTPPLDPEREQPRPKPLRHGVISMSASKPVPVIVASAVATGAASGASVPAKRSASPGAASPFAQQVDPSKVQGLGHFPRELKITYVWGILQAHMTWKVANGGYDLRLQTDLPGAARAYVSRGKVDRRGVRPERFAEYRNNKPDPYFLVDFDWQKMQAEVGRPGQRKMETLAAGDQDIFSTAFHVGLVGSKQEQSFAMFSGRRKYETARLVQAGEARLRFGDREVEAVLMRGQWQDRRVDFWLAPEWHNIPVRMTISLGRDMSFDIWANEITMDGRTVLDWVRPDNRP